MVFNPDLNIFVDGDLGLFNAPTNTDLDIFYDGKIVPFIATAGTPPTGWANDFNGVTNTSILKINGIAIANISKVNNI